VCMLSGRDRTEREAEGMRGTAQEEWEGGK